MSLRGVIQLQQIQWCERLRRTGGEVALKESGSAEQSRQWAAAAAADGTLTNSIRVDSLVNEPHVIRTDMWVAARRVSAEGGPDDEEASVRVLQKEMWVWAHGLHWGQLFQMDSVAWSILVFDHKGKLILTVSKFAHIPILHMHVFICTGDNYYTLTGFFFLQ